MTVVAGFHVAACAGVGKVAIAGREPVATLRAVVNSTLLCQTRDNVARHDLRTVRKIRD